MGQARYYLKASFAEPATGAIEAFFTDGNKAEMYWQEHRHEKPEMFWPRFKELFPVVYKYLGSPANTSDCNNALSRRLNFGSEDLDFDDLGTLRYTAEVWHLANWGPLCRFLESEFGATEANWISEEDLDPWANL